MKLDELLEKIEAQVTDYLDSGIDPSEVEVLLAIQPSYPLTMSIAGMVSDEEVEEASEPPLEATQDSEKVFWIAASDGPGSYNRSPYAPRAIWEVL